MRKLRYLTNVMKELGVDTDKAVVYEDNQECIRWTELHGKRTKHIDVRYHVSREAIVNNKVVLEYRPTKYMVADALTKPLGPEKFEYLVGMILIGDSNCSRQF